VALAEPRNGFEVVGVLREIFGHSDQELADYSQGSGRRFQVATRSVSGGPVGKTVNRLVELRERMTELALFSAMEEMVRTTQLRERLSVLPPDDFADGADEIEGLLTAAAHAEALGGTLETFAGELRTKFSNLREVRPAMPDAVQIISGHKAKGSEWDAVIVPFFARTVTVRPPSYPYLLRDPRSRESIAVLAGHDLDRDLKDAQKLQATQELERLLYVALTRARHTLVMVDDLALFSGAEGLARNAQANLLRCAEVGTNGLLFLGLPDTLSACAATQTAAAMNAEARARAQIVPALPEWAPGTLALAREHAVHFIKRNPSALAEAAQAEADPASVPSAVRPFPTTPNAGQLYGTWWHEFVERIDWLAPVETWDAAFAKALTDSPDPALSEREWGLLRQELTTDSALARLLRQPGAIIQAEMPFLWVMSGTECLEGIIDLAVFDPATGHWLLLDWKTNRATPKELPKLQTHYLPQLSAYWKAVSEMLKAPVTAGLYATASGQWLPYESPALVQAWDDLSQKPEALSKALQPEETDPEAEPQSQEKPAPIDAERIFAIPHEPADAPSSTSETPLV
jgi:ATP-dependent exoDNAse (exonuclease V) beta subunit